MSEIGSGITVEFGNGVEMSFEEHYKAALIEIYNNFRNLNARLSALEARAENADLLAIAEQRKETT